MECYNYKRVRSQLALVTDRRIQETLKTRLNWLDVSQKNRETTQRQAELLL
ncbi:MAG: hypothetical protein PVS3B3_34720 [Ktedonobacteraceae bacterium]